VQDLLVDGFLGCAVVGGRKYLVPLGRHAEVVLDDLPSLNALHEGGVRVLLVCELVHLLLRLYINALGPVLHRLLLDESSRPGAGTAACMVHFGFLGLGQLAYVHKRVGGVFMWEHLILVF